VRMTSPVRRPIWSREDGDSSSVDDGAVVVTSSRKMATPRMGSWHIGPWAVASWKAWEILSEKVEGVGDVDVVGGLGSGSEEVVSWLSWRLVVC